MTAPQDPEALAAELLDEVARNRKLQSPAIPLLLRSPELMALAPALRVRVLAHARRSGAGQPRTVLALVLYGAAAVVLLFAAGPGEMGMLLAIGWLPAWLLHIMHVRSSARRLARDLIKQN